MAASTVFFNGRLISVPGSYSKIDASGLESVGLGASGLVALFGTSEGGKPYSAVDEGDVRGNLQIATRPENANTYFRSGDLKEGAPLLFAPSVDAEIPGGAQEVLFFKVNPAAKSSASFDNTDGQALTLSSKDYGYFTTQINVEIAAGTAQGKLITIVFETTTEAFDDVGGDTVFELQYESSTPADGFSTITAQITAAALICAFTRTQIGLDSEVTNQVTAGQVIELVSSSASDTAVIVRLYGTDASDANQVVDKTLTGTTVVETTETWNSFHGAEIVSGTLVVTLTIQNDAAATTIATIAPAGTEAAIEFTVDTPVGASALTVVASGASTARLTLFGLSTSGTAQRETLQLNGTTPVAGTATWSRLDGLAFGEVAAGVTVTVSGNAESAAFAGLDTVQKLADRFNGLPGFTLTVVNSSPSTFASTDLDFQAATDIKAAAKLTALGDLAAIITKINNESDLVSAAAGSVGSGPPDNTTAAVFLAGGHEGSATPGQEAVATATTTDWQAALDLAKKVRINTIALLTSDPAIHAQGNTHCQYMAGIGRNERDMVVGLENTGRTDVPTKTEAKAQIVDLNSRHVRAVAQTIERYDSNGDRTELTTPFAALLLAGMQAGSPVGTPLTHKYVNALKIRQDSSWNPQDDAEELIQAGLCMFETIDGIGRRVLRNVTTHLTDSNMAYTEASVNEAVNYSAYNLRTTLERKIGSAGFDGTANAGRALAVNALGLLVGVALVAWRSLDVQLILDVIELAVEIAPVLPVNFVTSTLHLVTIPQVSAAA